MTAFALGAIGLIDAAILAVASVLAWRARDGAARARLQMPGAACAVAAAALLVTVLAFQVWSGDIGSARASRPGSSLLGATSMLLSSAVLLLAAVRGPTTGSWEAPAACLWVGLGWCIVSSNSLALRLVSGASEGDPDALIGGLLPWACLAAGFLAVVGGRGLVARAPRPRRSAMAVFTAEERDGWAPTEVGLQEPEDDW